MEAFKSVTSVYEYRWKLGALQFPEIKNLTSHSMRSNLVAQNMRGRFTSGNDGINI
jgi:hypothetical protein